MCDSSLLKQLHARPLLRLHVCLARNGRDNEHKTVVSVLSHMYVQLYCHCGTCLLSIAMHLLCSTNCSFVDSLPVVSLAILHR